MTDKAESNDFVSMKRALDSQCKDKLTEDDIKVVIDTGYSMGRSLSVSLNIPIAFERVEHWVRSTPNYGGQITEHFLREKAEEKKKQILISINEYPKLKERLEILQERYRKLLNEKAITGKDQEQDLKIVKSSIQDTIILLNQFRSHYNTYPIYADTWGNASQILNSAYREENQKLKAEIKKKEKEKYIQYADNMIVGINTTCNELRNEIEELKKKLNIIPFICKKYHCDCKCTLCHDNGCDICLKKQIKDLQQKATQGQRLIELINNWFETYPTRFKEWCEQSKILDEKYPWNEIDEQHENHEEYYKELAKLAERLNFGDFEHIIKRLLNQSKSEKQ